MESTLSYVDEWVSKKENEVSTGTSFMPYYSAKNKFERFRPVSSAIEDIAFDGIHPRSCFLRTMRIFLT